MNTWPDAAWSPFHYYDWYINKVYLAVPAQAYVARFLASFKEYPPRMKPGSFTIDKVLEKMSSPGEH
jgi:arylsulfatase